MSRMTRGLGSPGLASHRCSHFGVPKRDHPRKLGRADTRVQRFDSCKYACNGYGDTCCTASSLEPVQQSAALQHSRRREKRGTSARKPIGWERLAASTTPLDAVAATASPYAGAPATPAAPRSNKRSGDASRAPARQARERDRRRGGCGRDRQRHVGVGGHPPGRRRRGRCLVLRSAQMTYRPARHRRDACSTASDSLVDRRTGVGNAS